MVKIKYQNNSVSTGDTILLLMCQRGHCNPIAIRQGMAGENFHVSAGKPHATLSSYNKNIKRILDDMNSLLKEEDSDGYVFRPSRFALEKVWGLISSAYIDLDIADDLPRPFVSPDGRGGIRIEWTLHHRVVSLLCPSSPNRQSYIYHTAGDEHGANRAVSVDSLIMSLRWLLD